MFATYSMIYGYINVVLLNLAQSMCLLTLTCLSYNRKKRHKILSWVEYSTTFIPANMIGDYKLAFSQFSDYLKCKSDSFQSINDVTTESKVWLQPEKRIRFSRFIFLMCNSNFSVKGDSQTDSAESLIQKRVCF